MVHGCVVYEYVKWPKQLCDLLNKGEWSVGRAQIAVEEGCAGAEIARQGISAFLRAAADRNCEPVEVQFSSYLGPNARGCPGDESDWILSAAVHVCPKLRCLQIHIRHTVVNLYNSIAF